MSLSKLTKAQLIDLLAEHEETKFDAFKGSLGLPYQTDEEWIDYIKKLQDLNVERLKDVEELTERLSLQNHQLKDYLANNVH